MHWEINVSLNGQHYFGTHARSLTNEQKARLVATDLRMRFPESEGFEVSLTRYEASGHGEKF